MYLLQLGDQIAKAIMLKLAQERVRNIGRHVAAADAFADLGGKPLGNGGGQLLGAQGFTHMVIIPTVGLDSSLVRLPAGSLIRSLRIGGYGGIKVGALPEPRLAGGDGHGLDAGPDCDGGYPLVNLHHR